MPAPVAAETNKTPVAPTPAEPSVPVEETPELSEATPVDEIVEKTVEEISPSPTEAETSAPAEESVEETKLTAEKPQAAPSTPPQPPTKKASALSLASIQRKKDWEAKKQQQANTPEDLPEEEYSTEAFMEHWNAYLKLLQDDGRKILASSLASDTPRITPTHGIHLSLANDTMKKEIEREQGPLLAYLREKLQNYSLHLKLDVSATVAEKYAFTPQEKYEKLRKKNPAIDLLRKEFDLDF